MDDGAAGAADAPGGAQAEPPATRFRRCGACGRGWSTVDEFLDDKQVRVLGLQVAGHFPEANLMVFEHACGSSVSLRSSRLRELLHLPAGPSGRDLFGTEQCRELCLRLGEWSSCDNPCINAPDRQLLRLVLERKGSDKVPNRPA